jgi:hypothetical protein
MYEQGKELYPGASTNPLTTSAVGGAGITAAHHYGSKIIKMLKKV